MKRIVAVILLLIYFGVGVRGLMPYVDYLVNRQYIIENVCENRFDEAVMCSGMCYLEDELEKVAELSIPNEADSDAPISKNRKVFHDLNKEVYTAPEISIIELESMPLEEYTSGYTYQFFYGEIYLHSPSPPPRNIA